MWSNIDPMIVAAGLALIAGFGGWLVNRLFDRP